MSRRADPERIFQAGRAAIRNRQMSTGIDEATANRRCDAWVLEAAGRRLPKDGDYWQSSFDWIQEERAARRPGWT